MIIHTVMNTYEEKRDILESKTNLWKNKADKGVISSYSYSVNNLGQRTSVSTEGEAFSNAPAPWIWNYDVLGQVIKANNDNYSYDSIGNRKTSGKNNEVLENYQANSLNQYTAVNTNTPIYDNEGNLLSGLSKTASLPNRDTLSFVYNAENRSIAVKQGEQVLEECAYDFMGRRIRKGNSIIIYDGYNAIAEYNLNSKALKETYAWGLDLSGSIQNAGGVGGLLLVTDYTNQVPLTSYPTYDGNGNISEYLIDTNNGTISAHYEYDAFGNVNKKTGNGEYSYQFSTKPYDKTTGLNYYNYRLYDAVSGRWINRDPIEEEGGLNLYAMLNNNSVNKWDYLGFIKSGDPCSKCCKGCKKSKGKLLIQDSGTVGYNLKLSVVSPTFTSECKQEGKCKDGCCYEYYRWSTCYTGRCFGEHTAVFDKVIEADPRESAWRAIAVNIKYGYAWCSCNEGIWECNDVRASSNVLLYLVDSEFKPTRWVLQTDNNG